MSKVLAGTAFVLLGGATATGGVLLLTKDSKGAENKVDEKGEEQIDAELSKTLADFKSTDKSKGCVKSLFPNLENIGTEEDSTTVLDTNFFTNGTATTGCLVVNWDKYTKTESGSEKWQGNFRFLWAVKGGNKGFIIFLAGKTPTEANKQEVQWEGGIYTLSSSGSGDGTKWTAKKQHEITTASPKAFKKDNGTADTKKFPQPGDQWKGKDNTAVSTFWGWMGGTDDLDKITSSTDDSQSPASSLRAYWSWESQSSGSNLKKLSDWSKDWDTWCKEVFDANKCKAKELGEARQGTWTNRKYDTPTQPNGKGAS